MKLPTQNQVNTGIRYATVAATTAVTLLGLQAKGISLDQVKAVINALGDAVNNLVILAGAIAAFYASYKGYASASPASQAESLTKQAPGTVVITTPEIAAATPNAPNVIANTETVATVSAAVNDAKTDQAIKDSK